MVYDYRYLFFIKFNPEFYFNNLFITCEGLKGIYFNKKINYIIIYKFSLI